MRSELAIAYIAQRMREMRFPHYEIHIRQFALKESQTITIQGGSDLWVLCDENMFYNETNGNLPAMVIRVESENGVFDLTDEDVFELEHEHTGEITVTNHITDLVYVMFLQATPKKCEV